MGHFLFLMRSMNNLQWNNYIHQFLNLKIPALWDNIYAIRLDSGLKTISCGQPWPTFFLTQKDLNNS
jgi:hypothetical protein